MTIKREEIPSIVIDKVQHSMDDETEFIPVYKGRILKYLWKDPNALPDHVVAAMRKVGEERRVAMELALNNSKSESDVESDENNTCDNNSDKENVE
jgi:hypothetical protein